MLLAALSIVLRLAHAPAVEPPRWVELDWRAPAECPDAAAVHAAIEVMLPAEPERIDPLPRVEAIVQRQPEGFVLRLHLGARGAERTRELRAGSCASLVDAVAVEVGLLIAQRSGELAPAEATSPTEPAASVVPPRTTAPAETVTTRAPGPRRRSPLHWRVRAGVSMSARVLDPTPAAPTLGAALVGTRWAAIVDLALWPRGFAAIPGRTREGSRLTLFTVTVGGCARRPAAVRFAIAGCGGLELGALASRGIGLSDARRAAAASLALLLAPTFELAVVGPLRVSLGPWLRLGLVRPGVRIEGVGEIHRAAPWSLGAAVRVELEFAARRRDSGTERPRP